MYKSTEGQLIFSLNTTEEEEVQVMANHLRKLNSYLILYITQREFVDNGLYNENIRRRQRCDAYRFIKINY